MPLIIGSGEAHETLGDWAEALKPEFLGRVFGGRSYGCLITWHDPVFQRNLWAFCYGPDAASARELALRELVEQRWQGMLSERLLDGKVNVHG